MKYMRILNCAIILLLVISQLFAADPQEMPTVKKQVHPAYPLMMKKAGIEGEVWLKATIDESGRVVGINTEKATHKDFIPAASDALKQWEFNPGMKDGKPVKSVVMIPFKFKLGDKEDDAESPGLSGLIDSIKTLVSGKLPALKEDQISSSAVIVIDHEDAILSTFLTDKTKRARLVEGEGSKVVFSKMQLNESKNTAILVMKTEPPKGKKTRMHTIVLTKSTDGKWQIQGWHIST